MKIQQVAQVRGIGAAALLMSASVLLSRLLGYGRDSLLAHYVGAGAEMDAYGAAFQIPDILNYFLAGGALSIAFLPRYTALRTTHGESAADNFLATILGTLGLITIVATAILWWFTPQLVAIQFPKFSSETQALTISLTRIVLPAQIFFVTGGIIRAALFSRGRFGAAALAPLLYNGGIIIGGLCLYKTNGIAGFAWGALVGAFFGPFLPTVIDAFGKVKISLIVNPLDPKFIRYMVIAAPLMLGQSLLTVDEWYERWFGALLAEGSVAQLGYARRLMQAPVAIVGQAVAAAALPALTQLWAEQKKDKLNTTLVTTLQSSIGVSILCASAFFLLAEPLVFLLYRHGKFSTEAAVPVVNILRILCLAVPAWVSQQVAVRAFYARGDTWRPMILGTIVALVAIPLYWYLGGKNGTYGLALAGVIGMNVNAFATLILANKLHHAPRLNQIFINSIRISIIGIIAAAVTHFAIYYTLLNWLDANHRGVALLHGAVGAILFSTISIASVIKFGDTDTQKTIQKLIQKIVRR